MNDEQRASEAVFGSGGEPTGRLYNPYQDLYGAADLKSLESVYRLPSAPEYLFPDEAAVQRRNWSENLTYYTGCGYGAGAILGGVRGGIEGLRSQEATDTTKIRVNRLLNASGHRGRTMGNAFGILGLLYAGFESTASHYRDSDDMLNTVIAGLGTGVVYKAAAGPRTAAIAGALGGAAAAGLAAGKQLSKRYSPI